MMEKRNVPEIRFEGFEDEWEERKISSLAGETYGGGTPKTSIEEFWSGDIPWIQSSDITEHEVNRVELKKFISEEAVKKSAAKLVPKNSIAVVTRVGVGKLAIMQRPYTTSQDFLSLTNLDTDLHFTAYLLYKKIQSELNTVQGTSIKGITKEELLNKGVITPTLSEQEKIGKFFKNTDDLIILHQSKYEALQNIKKSMLEKMFPREGETVPEIRFSGFTGEWDQHEVKDIAPLQRGFDLPKSQMQDGIYPVVMSNGINGYHSEYKVKAPGVVTGRSGTIGNLHYIEQDYWPHNTTLWVTDFKGNVPLFIYYLYQHLGLDKFKSGSGVPTLNRNDVHDAILSVPKVEEQTKIANYLKSLDHLIALQHQQLEKLKNIKSACLKGMFV